MDVCLCVAVLCGPVSVDAFGRADHSFKGGLPRV
jgi:hypothetical protein